MVYLVVLVRKENNVIEEHCKSFIPSKWVPASKEVLEAINKKDFHIDWIEQEGTEYALVNLRD